MTSDETKIKQIFADWPTVTKRVTKDNKKNPEYHVVVAIKRLRTGKKLSPTKIMAKPCKKHCLFEMCPFPNLTYKEAAIRNIIYTTIVSVFSAL